MLVRVTEATFGRSVLVVGPESFLAERVVSRLIDAARSADVGIERENASALDVGRLVEMTGGGLFSSATIAVVTALDQASPEVGETLLSLAADVPSDVLLVLVHPGGPKGKPLADKLRKVVDEVIEVAAIKAWELASFVTSEARRAGGRIDADAAATVVDAVGTDTRALAAAIEQLIADGESGPITRSDVGRYFAGRAEVSAFGVADNILNGNRAGALDGLRWTLATGGAHVLVTGALANAFRQLGKYLDAQSQRVPQAALAKEVGVPPWKLKDLARQSRSWDAPSIGRAIQAVAAADAAVKGAASDPDFALERLVLTLSGLRPAGRR